MKNNLRGYIFSRSFLGERVPQHVQNLIIKNYCEINNFNYLLSATEYAVKNSFLMLEKVLNDLNKVDGIIMYSLFQLPSDKKHRRKIYNQIISNNKKLFFACEKKNVINNNDIELIEQLWLIKETLSMCYLYKELN